MLSWPARSRRMTDPLYQRIVLNSVCASTPHICEQNEHRLTRWNIGHMHTIMFVLPTTGLARFLLRTIRCDMVIGFRRISRARHMPYGKLMDVMSGVARRMNRSVEDGGIGERCPACGRRQTAERHDQGAWREELREQGDGRGAARPRQIGAEERARDSRCACGVRSAAPAWRGRGGGWHQRHRQHRRDACAARRCGGCRHAVRLFAHSDPVLRPAGASSRRGVHPGAGRLRDRRPSD